MNILTLPNIPRCQKQITFPGEPRLSTYCMLLHDHTGKCEEASSIFFPFDKINQDNQRKV